MITHLQRHSRSWLRGVFLAGWCAAMLGLPGVGRAVEPIDTLREALRIQISKSIKPNLELAATRQNMLAGALAKLTERNSIGELRRAYFLKEWEPHFRLDQPMSVLPFHAKIGKLLEAAIRTAGKDTDPEVRLALCIQIAEMADAEESPDLATREKFARRLTDLVATMATDSKSLTAKQAALHALGKITPDPTLAFPVLQKTLEGEPEVGPRRLAAYAVNDLAKNCRVLPRKEILKTIELAVSTLAVAKKKVGVNDKDEAVRGYSLQAIGEAAKALRDFVGYPLEPLVDKGGAGKKILDDLKDVLQAFQTANPQIVAALGSGETINVRLSAVQTLDQIGQARLNLVLNLNPEKRDMPAFVLDQFTAPDPFALIVARDPKKADLSAFTQLLYETDVRLRRGGIELLEVLRDGAAPAVQHISTALTDPDLFVKWTAARTVRYIDPATVQPYTVSALEKLLKDRDSNLSKAAAEAIEKLGEHGAGAVDSLSELIGNSDPENRSWDVENRVAAMKAVAGLGKAAQRALPKLLDAMADPEVRIRREAAYTIGRIGRFDDAPLTQRAMTALKKALGDEDAEVRLNASEAILSISPARK